LELAYGNTGSLQNILTVSSVAGCCNLQAIKLFIAKGTAYSSIMFKDFAGFLLIMKGR
jgi:hypothetical protein